MSSSPSATRVGEPRSDRIPPRLEEAALLARLDDFADAASVLVTSLGRGQFAAALAARSASTHVRLSLLDA